MRAKATALLFVCALAPAAVLAVSTASENWSLFEQGNAAMAQREFGKALSLYKEAILKAGIFPEAEVAVGDVYAEEGESTLALAQYEKAYNIRNSFIAPDMQYDVLYRSANLLQATGKYKLMEDKLNLIVQDDHNFQETATMRMRSQVEKNLNEKGLDRVLMLYSLDRPFSAAAHATLGWFDYRTGRFPSAVSHLLYAVMYRATQMNRFIRDRDAGYQFSTMQHLIDAIGASRELSTFAGESDFYKSLYYLAASTYAAGQPSLAMDLWRPIAGQQGAGVYRDLSQRQLKKPFVEPLLAEADQ